MTKESKTGIIIALVGCAVLAVYWFTPSGSVHKQRKKAVQERVILSSCDDGCYRKIPQVREYLNDLHKSIAENKAFLPLKPEETDHRGEKVQQLLLKDHAFTSDSFQDGRILHNDMMRILPAIVSSLDDKDRRVCAAHTCYQAEKYNFVTNTATRAIVDTDGMKVLSVERYDNMQPDISLRLKRIAEIIALKAPEVAKELGRQPRQKDITMANVRGTMKESPCENKMHLCVAPTFADTQQERALWAVVDLTELRLAAAKWAGLGKTTTPACISERTLQNRYIMEHFCQHDTHLVKNGWDITYRLTGSDGLEIRDVAFRGVLVLRSAKIVDWHVSYQQEGADKLDMNDTVYIEGRRVEFVRGEGNSYLFGYNDAMGCPLFSTSVVLAFNGPQVKQLPKGGGFMLTQDFRNPKWPMACNYRYENRFEFYDDGSFRIVGVNKGRGCGDHAIYRPVMRIDTAVGKKERLYSREGSGWRLWKKEGSESVPMHFDQYPYKIVSSSDPKKGYLIEPNYGQFADGSRGDHATLYATLFESNEGDKDLLTLGSCCDLEDDGVTQYLKEPELLADHDIVLWYVPRIRNDDQKGEEYCWADTRIGKDGNLKVQIWPCTVGPKFIPMQVVQRDDPNSK